MHTKTPFTHTRLFPREKSILFTLRPTPLTPPPHAPLSVMLIFRHRRGGKKEGEERERERGATTILMIMEYSEGGTDTRWDVFRD